MSTPTGSLYIQVYDKNLGKFSELPLSAGSINFENITTGLSLSTPSFSGFSFSNSLKLKDEIQMMPINIGLYNLSGSGSKYSSYIGILNRDVSDNPVFQKSGYLGNYALGYLNINKNSINSYSIGYFNASAYNFASCIFGGTNRLSGQNQSLSLGNTNTLNSGNNIYLIGHDNIINSGIDLILVGSQNKILNTENCLFFGVNNTNINSSNDQVIGNVNTLSGSNLNELFGSTNNFKNSNSNINFGDLNSYTLSTGNLTFGVGNTNSINVNSSMFGSLNFTKGNVNNIYGQNNTLRGNANNIYGDLNYTEDIDSFVDIYGRNNTLSGTTNSSIFGSNNNLDQQIINLLYQVELTGITGSGPTLFTGVTGYLMLGGYAGVPGSGGNFNFLLGNNNQTSLNQSSYIFGDSNQVLNNLTSYVFGSNNYVERSSNSYVFGQENSVSGFQNYVIGNSNEARSGDYNSIFIGINYTPTGDNKVATISLATVDSKIEINPSEIRLDSINRPKINGENIIIQSEFDTIADSLKQNGPTFTTNIFQDPYYDKLADKVFLSSFNYDSGASTSLTSDAQEFNSTSSLFLNKFNIFSTISYTGVSGFNVIYGNHTNSQFSPAWIVVDNSTSGVYYKNDITPFNITPQSGWYATGFKQNGLLYTGTSNDFGVNLVMGSRSGYMSVSTASFGTMYVPFFY